MKKTISDLGDKITQAQRDKINETGKKAKEILATDDLAKIRTEMENLKKSSRKSEARFIKNRGRGRLGLVTDPIPGQRCETVKMAEIVQNPEVLVPIPEMIKRRMRNSRRNKLDW